MKTCFKCGQNKPLSEFYRHSAMADGYLGKCKECAKRDVAMRRAQNIDYVRAYDKSRNVLPHRVAARHEYSASDRGREVHAISLRRQIERHPEKYKARTAVSNAVRDGRLTRLPCVVCGDPKSEGHHHDYAKPLDVIWLCNLHHREQHS